MSSALPQPHHGSSDLQLLLAGQPGVMAVIRRGDRRRTGRRDNVRRRQLQRKEKSKRLRIGSQRRPRRVIWEAASADW